MIWDGTERRSRKVEHPDGFFYEWRPTLLYVVAATMLSAAIVATDIRNTDRISGELRELVHDSCASAANEAFETEQASDEAFARIFERMERKIDHLVSR